MIDRIVIVENVMGLEGELLQLFVFPFFYGHPSIIGRIASNVRFSLLSLDITGVTTEGWGLLGGGALGFCCFFFFFSITTSTLSKG